MNRLKYDPLDYLNIDRMRNNPAEFPVAELKTVYTSFRRTAEKRLKRLESAGFTGGKDYNLLKSVGMPTIPEMKTQNQLYYNLRTVAAFLRLQRSTVTGEKAYRKMKMQQFKDMGLNVPDNQYESFSEFLSQVTAKMHGRIGSDTIRDVARIYSTAYRMKLDPRDVMDNYNYWQENIDTIQQIRRIPKPSDGKRISSAYIEDMLENGM